MGKVARAVGSVATAPIKLASKGAEALGLTSKQGEYFSPEEARMRALQAADAGSMYQQGTQDISSNPLLAGMFGQGGMQSRLDAEERNLAGRGFSLQPEDIEAYGQTSGDIARLFGQQEQAAAQSLASRGLAAAPSGAAGVAFSGLQGNKMEQLARAQMQIAQQRMQNNMERLNQTRQLQRGLAQDAAGLSQQRADARRGLLESQAGAETAINEGRYNQLQDKRAARRGSILENFGQGLRSSATQIGAAPGTAVQSAAKLGGGSMFGGGAK